MLPVCRRSAKGVHAPGNHTGLQAGRAATTAGAEGGRNTVPSTLVPQASASTSTAQGSHTAVSTVSGQGSASGLRWGKLEYHSPVLGALALPCHLVCCVLHLL